MGLNTTPATWAAGEIPPASKFNTEIRDALTGLQASWDTYTPTWTAAGTAPALGNGTLTGKFWRSGKTIHYEIHLIPGSTTTYGTQRWDFTLPVTANNTNYDAMGVAIIRDTSANSTLSRTVVLYQTKVFLQDDAGAQVTGTVPFTWATTDQVNISGTYEAA